MRVKFLFIPVILLALGCHLHAQTFEHLYGGSGNDQAFSVVQTPDDGFLMAGYTESFGGMRDAYVVKIDDIGNVQWSNRYGTLTSDEEFRKIIQTSDGGFIAVGRAVNSSKTYAVRISNSGALIWSNTFDVSNVTTDQEIATDVIQTSDGNFAIAATVFTPSGSEKSAIIKVLNSTGAIMWANDYDGLLNLGTGIVELDDATLMTSSGTLESTAGFYDYSLMHLTSGGAVSDLDGYVGANNFGGDGHEASYNLIRTADNGFLLSGGTWSYDSIPILSDGSLTPEMKNMYVKTDSVGNFSWARLITTIGRNQRTFSVIQSTTGDYVTASFDPAAPSNFYVYTFDESGSIGWSRTFGNQASDDVSFSVIQTSDGGYAIIGYSNDPGGNGGYDFFLVKTDSDGNVLGSCDQQDIEPYGGMPTIILNQHAISVNGPLPATSISTVVNPQAIFSETPLCPITADFTVDDSLICVGDCISFTDLSTGSPIYWTWNFPGSNTPLSFDQNPTNICYDTAGTYLVELTASTDFATNTMTKIAYITVNALPTPAITLSADSSLCTGEQVTLSSNYSSGNSWAPNGETDADIVVSQAGTYTLTVTDNNGCAASDSVVIVIEDCCFAANNPAFFQITTNITITSDEVWDDKYYIAPGVIVTVDGATLDITNVDVVFGACAGIDFINGANLRATNSVFRPCDESKSWRGLSFDYSSGIINECTFKNAYVAARLKSEEPVRFTNNLFLNNHFGITIQGIYNESITGNTFTIDNTPIEYLNYDCDPIVGIHYGISSFGATFGDVISQNDFIYSAGSSTSAVKQFIGIFNTLGTNGKISSNNFSNLFRSLDFAGVSSFEVTNNKMEITKANFNNQIQIRVGSSGSFQTTNIEVSNNELVCTAPINNPTHSGIFVQLTNGSNITGNTINGFGTGLFVINCSNTNATENKINDSRFYGIYITSTSPAASHIDIACNEIKMEVNSFSTMIAGISYRQTENGDRDISMRDNCIFETTHAIYAIGLPSTISAPIPTIVGNYMYNYSHFGVLNQNFSGSIGSNLTQSGAGKNSFISNNIPGGAIDIASIGTSLLSYGNFGISSVSNVTTLGNNLFNSVTSCGNQIGTISSEIGDAELCTDISNNFIIATTSAGIASLTETYKQLLETSNSDYFMAVVNAMCVLSINDETTQQDELYNTVLSQNKLSPNEVALFYHFYLMSTKKYDEALANLPTLSGIDDYSDDFIEVQRIQIELLSQNLSPTTLEGTNLASLQVIAANKESYVSGAATDLLQAAGTLYDYNFENPLMVEGVNVTAELINTGENQLEIFPNPAVNQVTIRYAVENPEACQLRVTDAIGRVIYIYQLTYNSTETQIDVSQLAPGSYLVTLYENDLPAVNCKLIIQSE